MGLLVAAEPMPLRLDRRGVARVGATRVTLDTVVAAFDSGATPEEIALQYPTVQLQDIYHVIGYYLEHRQEVDEYLEQRRRMGEKLRRENERRFDPRGVRARLLARRPGRGK